MSGLLRSLRQWWQVIRLLPRVGPGLTAVVLALTVVQPLLGLGFMVATGYLVGQIPAAIGGDTQGATIALAVLGAAYLGQQLLGAGHGLAAAALGRRFNTFLEDRAMAVLLAPPGIAHLEDAKVRDLAAEASNGLGAGRWRPNEAPAAFATLLSGGLSLLIAVGLVVWSAWWLGLLLGVAVVWAFRELDRHIMRMTLDQLDEQAAGDYRRSEYEYEFAVAPGSAKEVRLSGFAPWTHLGRDDARDLAPFLYRPAGRPDRCAGRRPDHRDRYARRPGRVRWVVRRAVPAAGGEVRMMRGMLDWWRTYRLVLVSAFAADRWGSVLLLVLVPASYVAPALGAVAAGAVVDAGLDGSWPGVARAATLAGLTVLFTLTTLSVSIYLIHAIDMKVEVQVRRRLADILTGLPGIEHHERPDYLDRVQVVRRQAGMIGAGLNATAQMLAVVCQVVVVLALLAQQDLWLLLLPVFAVPSFFLSGRARKVDQRAREETAADDRLRHRFHHLAADLPVAREARLFGLGDELRTRRAELAKAVDNRMGQALTRSTALRSAGQLIFVVGYLGAIGLVLRKALDGQVSAGDVTTAVILAGQVRGFIADLVGRGQFMANAYQASVQLRWLESFEQPEPAGDLMEAPDRIRRAIRLENVTFAYPGGRPPVLDDLSLTLPAGSVVALVGENGAGKSTLVKLLLRMYEPTSGAIRVDEHELTAIDLTGWRSAATGAFQDFCRPEFTAGEAIGLGDPRRLDDEAALAAAARSAGAESVLDRLPDGLRTQLGPAWQGGVDLSGGQWQRLALARGRMRSTPLLQVLDEPTAALDAEAGAAMFESFVAASQEARERGGVTLLVTHRFSTVRMADRIVVLDAGRIVEQGDHEQLVGSGGLYAELYSIQASADR